MAYIYSCMAIEYTGIATGVILHAATYLTAIGLILVILRLVIYERGQKETGEQRGSERRQVKEERPAERGHIISGTYE